jgi:heptosyltransferase-2
VVLTGIYVCPHHPDDGCHCRKPETGMIEQACREHGLDRTGLYVVGDRERDVLSGQKAGARTVLVLSGEESQREVDRMCAERRPPDHVANGMTDVSDWILHDRLSRRPMPIQAGGGGNQTGA